MHDVCVKLNQVGQLVKVSDINKDYLIHEIFVKLLDISQAITRHGERPLSKLSELSEFKLLLVQFAENYVGKATDDVLRARGLLSLVSKQKSD